MTIKGLLYSSNHGPVQIFRLLEDLPNLSDLVLNEYKAPLRLPDLALLVQVAERNSLRHLSFVTKRDSIATGLPVTGPRGLSSLFIGWCVRDELGTRGKSLAHLSAFLQPSLATLTHVDVTDFDSLRKSTDLQYLDFHLWPVCSSMRNFEYRTTSRDTVKVLNAVSETFPNLTHLNMIFDGYGYKDWGVWTVCICLLICLTG